ncbi:efflux RND transporter permease subunit [Amphritea pacifica]|uniref:Efflux RND transporter permease subunit n=1 Tax=Amphritea pacifica TaxID=2811233 RepID=A0ABS2WDG9_9GAMM|nr:efflux RND transporter permease subunit [Amphritea pacifica]MBN0989755.1 efflux RND transporter permease subunit [Amphritea pacifica]
MIAALVAAAIDRSRTSILILLFFLVGGMSAFLNIPKEADPDVAIPIIYVSIPFEGISPDDAVRLLVRPMEKELKSIEGVKEMRSVGSEGHASVTLEFDAGFDSDTALQDVRERVDIAKGKLPADADEPQIHEVNVALFPVLNIAISGEVSERIKLKVAKDLQDEIEGVAGVLEVDIGGEREELMEIEIEPQLLESYQLDFETVLDSVARNNQLVAAGAVDTGSGRQVLKVPGVVSELSDMLNMPVKSVDGTVVTVGDIAKIRKTYKDPEGFARVDGGAAMVLEVKKKVGANIIDTIEAVQRIVAERSQLWPQGLKYSYILDQSTQIRSMLRDLMNNVLSGIILVMVVVLAAMGLRTSLLVGLAIPGSFLASMMVLKLMGFTLNIVVLFSLILVVGMLVDGAIVVAELAERRMSQGLSGREAFRYAASRMAWPVIAGTATTLVVFMPLMFWPGVIGEFMKYLPATVVVCLTASLFMALIFMPVVGAVSARKRYVKQNDSDEYTLPQTALNRAYTRLMSKLLHYPVRVFIVVLIAIGSSYGAYAVFGKGVEFFPDIEPEMVLINLHARGDLSIYEKDRLLRQVEQRVMDIPGLKSVYARSFNQPSNDAAEDVVGVIQFQLDDWDKRDKAAHILAQMRQKTADLPGVIIETRKAENGPSEGKPIKLFVSGYDSEVIYKTVADIRRMMDDIGGFSGAEDDRPLPGIEWRIIVNREEASRYGASIALVGQAVRLITNGIKVTDYRPETSDDEVDIMIRFPEDKRNLDQLMQMQLSTRYGMMPISNFIELKPAPKTGVLKRVDSRRVITIQADAEEGHLVNDLVVAMQQRLAQHQFDPQIRLTFKGEDEQQKETGAFLIQAFGTALFLMALILVTQFNSLYQAGLVLSAIVFSTAGVLIGLMVAGQPFGIVMVGVGIIALAGIVVNNNIVLIDCYNDLRRQGRSPYDAALQTGSLRLRPVVLTAVTTVLGLMPMVLSMNIDLINRDISFGAPSTQWWTQLASAIAGGLSFATILTLFLTPCLLVLGESKWFRRQQPQPETAELI